MKRSMIGLIVLAVAIAGCVNEKSPRGFRLPDGNAAQGEQNFISHGCFNCHTIADVELPDPTVTGPVTVPLGGETTRVHTYGELVTSVINPSHRLATRGLSAEEVTDSEGKSLMRNYNDVMTIQELVDIVAFLQAHYKVVPPEYTYPYYGP